MECDIQWGIASPQWHSYLSAIPNPNFLQSKYYADAMYAALGQKAKRGLISINGQAAGIVQLLETGLLWNAVHAVMLDRGPLWFEGFGGAAHVQCFFQTLHKTFPPRFGRKRRILPEIEDGPTVRKLLEQVGLKRYEDRSGYQTIILDLQKDEQALKDQMKKNWRGALNKAQRSDLEITWDNAGALLPWMLEVYAKDKADKGYNGANPKLLHKIAGFAAQGGNCLIGQAKQNAEPLAAVMLLTHGSGATYQIGWASPQGRGVNANHLLLWQAITMLKDHGIHYFDLGGVNDETAKGVKEFKQGLGGPLVQFVGHYR